MPVHGRVNVSTKLRQAHNRTSRQSLCGDRDSAPRHPLLEMVGSCRFSALSHQPKGAACGEGRPWSLRLTDPPKDQPHFGIDDFSCDASFAQSCDERLAQRARVIQLLLDGAEEGHSCRAPRTVHARSASSCRDGWRDSSVAERSWCDLSRIAARTEAAEE